MGTRAPREIMDAETREDFMKTLALIDVDPHSEYGKFLIEMRERPEDTPFDMERGNRLLKEYGTKGRR